MEQGKRACFAFIAASLVNKQTYHRVVDQNSFQNYNAKAYDIATNVPHFYDQNRGGQVKSTGCGFYVVAGSGIQGRIREFFELFQHCSSAI